MRSPEELSVTLSDPLDPFALGDSDLSDVLASAKVLTAKETIEAELAATYDAESSVALAIKADELDAGDLKRKCLEQAIALDRNCQSALLMQAAGTMDDGDPSTTFALLEETARAGLLPDNVLPLHLELSAHAAVDERLEGYLRMIGRIPAEAPARTLSIVLVTNLFPPQELGGYGRMMWEFAHGLIARGHTVRVLTADVAGLAKNPTADEQVLEANVHRTLELAGTWEGGKAVPLPDRSDVARRMRDNASRIGNAVSRQKADLVLAGNLDFLGVGALEPALSKGIPVLHALANAIPGYRVAEQPGQANYWVAPCSDWNGIVFRQAGYVAPRIETLYPGARIDRFFRLFLPDTRRLRICYASLVLPYKGVDTLVHALLRLHAAGIPFTAEIAGDAPDASFLAGLKEKIQSCGLGGAVRFTGFLDRTGLSALFARSNVLVFPSRFEEPFGISQVEALAAGLVVISSGTGGAKEVIRDGVDGLLFRAGDEVDLATKLHVIASNPGLIARLQRAGQSRATVFSVQNAVQKIEALAGEMQIASEVSARRVSVERELANARADFTNRKYADAVAKATEVVKVNPDCADAYVLLGEVALLRSAGTNQAIDLFQQALTLGPGNSNTASLLADALCRAGRLPEADTVLSGLLQQRPRSSQVLNAAARLRQRQGNPADAVALLEEALRLEPHNPNYAISLGNALKRIGRLEEALDCHRRSVGVHSPVVIPDLKRGRVRVAFVLQFPAGWTSLESVYQAFRDDARFDVTLIGCPFLHENKVEGGSDAIYQFLNDQGVSWIKWTELKLEPGFSDILFLQLPYDATRPAALRTRALLKLVPRIAYIPYGLEIGGGEENTTFQFDQNIQQVAWAIFARSSRHKAMFARFCSAGDAHVVVTGHPKMDQLHLWQKQPGGNPFTTEAAGRPVVFWNPQFDIKIDGTGHSTFLRWQDFLIAEFSRRPELLLVIRPHPLFFGALDSRGIWTKEQIAGFRSRCAAPGNIVFDSDPSYHPIFAASAAMISDGSSFLLEYAGTGKPLLYLRNRLGPQLNSDGEFVERHCHVADDETAIVRFLDAVTARVDSGNEQRMRAYKEYIYLPETSAAEEIKRAVVKRLQDECDAAGRMEELRRAGSRAFWAACSDTHLAPRSYYSKASAALAARLPSLLKPTARLIDVGCGNGEMTLLAAPYCRETTGYDVSPSLVAQAQTAAKVAGLSHVSFHVLDLAAGIPEQDCDVIFCLGVLSCIHEDSVWLQVLERFSRMLSAGGVLVLRDTVSAEGRKTSTNSNGYYACYRGREEYLAAVARQGFDIIECSELSPDNKGLENHLWFFRRVSRVS